jgi:uncharacterized protein (TIGR02145 family)
MGLRISRIILLLITTSLILPGCTKDASPAEPLIDIDGNNYKTVKIGSQIWMSENLKTTRFNDGTEIPLTIDSEAWASLTTPGYCWYNCDAQTYKEPYGALYNGYTIATGKLCPVSWHVPEIWEWRVLIEFLGDSTRAGGKIKEAGTTHWLSPNRGADNSSGFTAPAAGIRYFEGTFASILSYTGIWSGTSATGDKEWFIGLYFADPGIILNYRNKKHGFSVRCLKD